MTSRAAAVVLALALAGCSAGDRDTRSPPEAPEAGTKPVEILVVEEPAPVVAHAGETVEIRVPVRIAPGFHVQANPAAAEFLIPLELTLPAADGLIPGSPGYPPSRRYRLDGADDDLLTYEGRIEVTVPVEVAADIAPGPRRIEGSLRYQACDDRRCFAPATVPVGLSVSIRK